MTIHIEKSVYDDCQQDIEIAFDTVFPPNSPGKAPVSVQRSLAWLCGELQSIFVWDNSATIGINHDEYIHYIIRLQNTITALTRLSENALVPKECQRACFNCANTLQDTRNRLIAIKPFQK